jgi:hypothetical protein
MSNSAACVTCIDGAYSTIQGASSMDACDLTVPSTLSTSEQIASAEPITSSKSSVVTIFQFKVSYQLAEITDVIRGKMVLVVSSLLSVQANRVILSFSQVSMTQRNLLVAETLAGVLVSVGLADLYGSESATVLASQISQDVINAKMVDVGLKPVQLIVTTATSLTTIPGSRVLIP